MRRPSGRVLANRVDVYSATWTRGLDGSPMPQYPTVTYPAEPCSVQFEGVRVNTDEFRRVSEDKDYRIVFGRDLGLKPRDKIVWVDNAGTTRLLFVEASKDYAGRGAAYGVRATETV